MQIMRHAFSVAVLATMLIAETAFAAPPRHASKQNATAPPAAASTTREPPASAVAPADQKRIQAIRQYQHDLVSVVALRSDPAYLLGAAILARPFKHQTRGLDFDALSQRAAAAPDAGPAAEWARLGICKSEAECPNADAFAYLEKNAADNAAVWIVALDVAARDKNAEAERAALKRAAGAQMYDDYFGKALAGVAKTITVLPPRADTIQNAHDGQPDNPEGVRVLVAVMGTQAHIRPTFGPVEDLCSKNASDKRDDIKSQCLDLAHTLQWGSSPTARAMGLRIQSVLDPDDKAQNDQASRDLAWQVHQYSDLLQHALTDPSLASAWLALARNGGTELSLILASLRANHIPLDAPDANAPTSADSSGQ
ncbi:MAG TPA: hypothetical protein VFW60_02795 [Rhodanobacteraceae bacterium]|nr:hypothetical protein [Rhodanobacteraceae bacterium]